MKMSRSSRSGCFLSIFAMAISPFSARSTSTLCSSSTDWMVSRRKLSSSVTSTVLLIGGGGKGEEDGEGGSLVLLGSEGDAAAEESNQRIHQIETKASPLHLLPLGVFRPEEH